MKFLAEFSTCVDIFVNSENDLEAIFQAVVRILELKDNVIMSTDMF